MLSAAWLCLCLPLLRWVSSLRPPPLPSAAHRRSLPLPTSSGSMEEEESLELVEPPLPEDRLRYCARVMYDGAGFR